MPIQSQLAIRPITDEAFAALDKLVMGCAFASQNTLGRLCDESVYEKDLAARLKAAGVTEVHTQVPVTVSHAGFSKTYRLDLVVEQMVYELKTAAGLTTEHEAQAIHYAALLGIDRIKLLNFGSSRVGGRLIRTPFAQRERRQVSYDVTRWQPLSDQCEGLQQLVRKLLADWGAFLDVRLYAESLIYFQGGESGCLRRVPLARDGLNLGTHEFSCHADKLAFAVTTLTDSLDAYEQHLRRLLRLTTLRGLQWINLNHAEIKFLTLLPDKGMETEE
jgi:GxxExxY protein